MTTLTRWIGEDDGQDLIEYGLLAALISIACLAAVAALGTAIAEAFSRVADQLGDDA